MVEREPEPSLGQARGAPVSVLRMAAENYFRMGLLHRTRHRIDATERDKTSAIFRFLFAPHRDHCRKELLGARTFMIEWRTDSFELRLEIADADSEDQPPVREHVD